MQVKNNTSFPIIAVCSFASLGEGAKKLIKPNSSNQVLGPPIAKIEGRICYAVVTGIITCHSNHENRNGFYVAEGHPLHINRGDACVSILHHADIKNYATKSLCDDDQK